MSGYGDDRPGMMRVHIADQRGRLACARYSRNVMRAHAKARGATAATKAGLKSDLGWYMAQHGLIDADGYLRDGFPEVAP